MCNLRTSMYFQNVAGNLAYKTGIVSVLCFWDIERWSKYGGFTVLPYSLQVSPGR